MVLFTFLEISVKIPILRSGFKNIKHNQFQKKYKKIAKISQKHYQYFTHLFENHLIYYILKKLFILFCKTRRQEIYIDKHTFQNITQSQIHDNK